MVVRFQSDYFRFVSAIVEPHLNIAPFESRETVPSGRGKPDEKHKLREPCNKGPLSVICNLLEIEFKIYPSVIINFIWSGDIGVWQLIHKNHVIVLRTGDIIYPCKSINFKSVEVFFET
jgi:hypothetical protein